MRRRWQAATVKALFPFKRKFRSHPGFVAGLTLNLTLALILNLIMILALISVWAVVAHATDASGTFSSVIGISSYRKVNHHIIIILLVVARLADGIVVIILIQIHHALPLLRAPTSRQSCPLQNYQHNHAAHQHRQCGNQHPSNNARPTLSNQRRMLAHDVYAAHAQAGKNHAVEAGVGER